MNSITVMLKVMRAVLLANRHDDPAFSDDTLNHPVYQGRKFKSLSSLANRYDGTPNRPA